MCTCHERECAKVNDQNMVYVYWSLRLCMWVCVQFTSVVFVCVRVCAKANARGMFDIECARDPFKLSKPRTDMSLQNSLGSVCCSDMSHDL